MKKKLIRKHFENLSGFIRILKLSTFLFFFAVMNANAGVNAEQNKLSLDVSNQTIKEVLQKIEGKTDYSFLYNDRKIDVTRRVNLNVQEKTIKEILDNIFKGTDVEYVIKEKQIVLVNKSESNAWKDGNNQKIRTINGVVSSSSGETLPGVSVRIKDSKKGTITNVDGRYSISDIPANSTLVFSYIGMKTREVEGSFSVINVIMDEDVIGLDEVVAIGYGTIKKRDLTGAVASVDGKRLENIPATNLTSSLQGSVAGISISTPYGAPGSSSSILIRGLNSINASNDPLVVIDGIPGGSIDDINPGDIKSMEVLKDAASTAIYGSRATSGVIIITTKTGSPQKSTINYDTYIGISTPSKKIDLMDVDEYIEKRREMYRMTNNLTYDAAHALTVETILGTGNELDMYNMGKSYDWQEEMFRTAPMQSHSLSLNGGNEKTQYYVSANYVDQTGLVKNSGFERKSVRANVSSQVTDWLKFGTSLFALQSTQDCIQNSVFSASFQISPLGKMYEDENTKEKYTLYPMNPDTYIGNPFTDMEIKDQREKTRVMNSTFMEISFLKDFMYKVSVNNTFDFINNKYFVPFYTKQVEAFDKNENASITRNNYSNLNIENLLTYNKIFGNHNLGATFVFSTEKYKGEGLYAYARDFGSDYYGWTALQLGNVDYRDMSSYEENTFLESLLGRLNYSFKGKYIAQFTVRRDRSSKFSEANRNAIFPGGSLGWRISDEPFMKKATFVDNIKFRMSYAMTGNQGIGYRSIYNVGNKVYYTTGQDASGQIVEGLVQSTLANKDLRWEKSAQANIGLDFSIYKGKLSGVIECYQTKTSDLLLNRDISSLTGFTSMLTNIGSVENKGLEIALNSNVINNNNFRWDVSTSFTTNKNKITELYGDGLDDYSNYWFIGKPIGVIYDYVFDGILQEGETAPEYMDNTVGVVGDGKNILSGEAKVKDLGGWKTLEDGTTIRTKIPDGKIDEADMTIIGQTQPKWFGSFGMNFRYRNFDASFFINHVQGTKRMVPIKISDRTQSLDITYYTDENPSTQYGRPAWSSKIDGIARTGNSYGYLSYYQDGSYTRLQDVTFGYSIPKSLLSNFKINQVRIYVSGQNLLTFTDFIGYDPSLEYESNQTGANVDRLYGYPTTHNWLVGLKVNF